MAANTVARIPTYREGCKDGKVIFSVTKPETNDLDQETEKFSCFTAKMA
jgi:hypothetical protein